MQCAEGGGADTSVSWPVARMCWYGNRLSVSYHLLITTLPNRSYTCGISRKMDSVRRLRLRQFSDFMTRESIHPKATVKTTKHHY